MKQVKDLINDISKCSDDIHTFDISSYSPYSHPFTDWCYAYVIRFFAKSDNKTFKILNQLLQAIDEFNSYKYDFDFEYISFKI